MFSQDASVFAVLREQARDPSTTRTYEGLDKIHLLGTTHSASSSTQLNDLSQAILRPLSAVLRLQDQCAPRSLLSVSVKQASTAHNCTPHAMKQWCVQEKP